MYSSRPPPKALSSSRSWLHLQGPGPCNIGWDNQYLHFPAGCYWPIGPGWKRETNAGSINLKGRMHTAQENSSTLPCKEHIDGSTQLCLPLQPPLTTRKISLRQELMLWMARNGKIRSPPYHHRNTDHPCFCISEFLIMWNITLNNVLVKQEEFAFEYQITLGAEGFSIDKIIWFLKVGCC